MTAQSSPTTVVQDAGQANLELAESLRELASWLEMHAADIPELWLGYLHFRNEYIRSDTARAEMTAFARALGERATEKCLGGKVEIEATFGPVKVSAGAPIADLRDAPPEPQPPEYEPIIPAEDELLAGHNLREERLPHALRRDLGISEPVSDPPCTDAEDEAWRDMEARR